MDNTNINNTDTAKKSNATKIIVAIIVVVILIVVGGIFMFGKSEESSKTVTPTPFVTEIMEPTPTKKPEIDKTSVKIQVQNGTGTPGQAAAVVEALKTAGYSADNIKSGNAEDYDHSTTTISMQEGFDDVAEDIKNSLMELHDNVEISTSNLESSSEYNIVVITGGTKYEEPTKAATSSPTIKLSPSPSLTVSPTSSTATPSASLSPSLSPTPKN